MSPQTSSHRTLLALGLVAVLAVSGCAGIGGPPTETAPPGTASPTPSPTRATTSDAGHYRSYTVSARRTSPGAIVEDVTMSRDEVAADLVWRADEFVTPLFDDGSAVRIDVSAEPDPAPGPFESGTFVRENGTIYALERNVRSRREATGFQMRRHGPLSPARHDDYDRATEEAIDFESLSPADERVFAYAAPTPDDSTDGVTTAGYTYVFPVGTDPETATLVDGARHYVRYGGELYRIRMDERVTGAVRYRIEYTRTLVANSTAAFFERRQESLVTPLTPETTDESVYGLAVEAVRDGDATWDGTRQAPERFRAIEDWARDRPPSGRSAYVRYEGTLYEIRVEKVIE